MRTMKSFVTLSSIAVLAATTAVAQNPRAVERSYPATSSATRPVVEDYHNQANENFLTKANKASGLIGMDVRNPQNEKLGDIKDLVLDLHSGRIAYAVLSVGGFLGIGDKYIAVPPSEFSLAPDGKDLILNADKAKIQNAPGFAKNNWPTLNDPSWRTHASYWGQSAMGTLGVVGTGRETGGNLNYATFSGRVLAVDGVNHTVTVEGPSGKQVFHMGTVGTGTLKSDTNHMLDNLKVGDHVTVKYYDHAGSYIAESISPSHRK